MAAHALQRKNGAGLRGLDGFYTDLPAVQKSHDCMLDVVQNTRKAVLLQPG